MISIMTFVFRIINLYFYHFIFLLQNPFSKPMVFGKTFDLGNADTVSAMIPVVRELVQQDFQWRHLQISLTVFYGSFEVLVQLTYLDTNSDMPVLCIFIKPVFAAIKGITLLIAL